MRAQSSEGGCKAAQHRVETGVATCTVQATGEKSEAALTWSRGHRKGRNASCPAAAHAATGRVMPF